MELFFANFVHPEDAAQKEIGRLSKKCIMEGEVCTQPKSKRRAWWDVLTEQMINAAIVGGIAACSVSFEEWDIPIKAFGLTFLIELRKYRKL